jgi:serine/threonine-protein kinase
VTEAPVTLAPGDVLGGYRLEAPLGQGAMGVVFRGVPASGGAPVALKVLRPELATHDVYVRRFEREAQVASAVRHPALVSVLAAGTDDGIRYLVCELADGETLEARLGRGTLGLPDLVDLAVRIGEALDVLAEHDLVHRDVKPANIILSAGGARLADFGLARGPADTVLTRPGQLLGSVAYMAPELVEGQPATAASDLYSLGCVLFECVAGSPPFTGKLFEVVYSHVEREPSDPLAERGDVPRGVGDAIRAALTKDPAARPRSGRLLARLVRIGARSASGSSG